MQKILLKILILQTLLLLSGCAIGIPSSTNAFSTPVVRDFNADVLRKTALFKDTTATNELKDKYRADWLTIQKQINAYEKELEEKE